MIEIERRRAGKDLARIDDAMTLSDAQRVFFAGIHVMKVLGWAWRWAEVGLRFCNKRNALCLIHLLPLLCLQ